ncbi:flagellar type III secretion system pore protein FliP [Tissierella creatinophila]|uniref:Flagellar biosynthetic protein FliP n=1 Tax=Tissierella creatinophila DSM 6911 TaxID=1123403 RepID=A0A1U7M910_TISCR|nr:flagellar type III secretion system pore protein FliP [Tissierella creatinophila]OLS03761.1 flagellar biosynthetic protein FliP precursor [Tissierella creatinophila DSM 6911]
MKNFKIFIIILTLSVLLFSSVSFAAPDLGDLGIILDKDGDRETTVDTLKLFIVITILTLAPSFLILTTCFTRIIVVLSFLRNALGTQQAPPNQLLIGLALFLTFFIMRPVYTEIMNTSVTPFLEEDITRQEAMDRGAKPLKEFMLKETREKDIALFLRASGSENVAEPMDVPITTVIPAFALSELRTAFSMGFLLFIPFLVIDMVVASILMSMGMFMLPPVMISLPFKILLFVLVDGWHVVIKSLIESFI